MEQEMHSIALIDRLIYDLETGCWNWSRKGKEILASRLSAILWLGLKGPDDPRDVLHRCDNPACFNPKHLFLGSHTDNMRDSAAKGRHHCSRKTHCPQGHSYSGDNVVTRNGRRHCRQCWKDRAKRKREQVRLRSIPMEGS